MNIPKHWLQLPLSELVISQKGKKPIKLAKTKFRDSVPYLDIEAVEKGIISQYADPYSTTIASDSDIFVVWDGSRSGLVAKGMNGAVGSTLVCLTPLSVNSSYLFYFLKSKYNYFNENTVGASIPHVNSELFYSLVVPIPPLKEQESIVADLEKRLSEYGEDFEKVESELTQIIESQKSIIEQAVTGQLTTNWRKNKKIGDSRELFFDIVIPKTWQKTKLEDVSESISDGDHQAPKRAVRGVPFVLISNIKKGNIDFTNVGYVSKAYYDDLKDFRKPRTGDLLYSTVGSIGNVVLITDEPEFCFQRHIALIRPNKNCFPKFIYYVLRSNIFHSQALKRAKGVAQQTLNLSELRSIEILLPPIDEQKVIVKQVEGLLTQLVEMENNFITNRSNVQQLYESVVQMAFTGTLSKHVSVKQNVTDYTELLEKVKTKAVLNLKEQRKNQSTLLNSFFMNAKDVEGIKNKIKELALEKHGNGSVLSQKDIDLIRDSIQSSVKNFDYDDFSRLFIELVQDKVENTDNLPFFLPMKDNGKLSFKITHDETTTASTVQ